MSTRYVILGGNIAGTTLAAELRRGDQDISITIIERTSQPCYSRVLLPHYIKNLVDREKVFMKTIEWYQEQEIDFMNDVEALSIDEENRFVSTSEGREIPYDKLIITTGGDVNTLPFSQREISYFRGIEDADQMKTLIAETLLLPEAERRMVIIGGGFIAMEYVNICEHFGIKASVILRSGGFWSKVLGEYSQKVLLEHAKSGGVDVHTEDGVRMVMGGDSVKGVLLESGEELPAAMIGIGIGVHTERALLKNTTLELGLGIKTNNFFETSVKDIYAIGDIAEFEDIVIGRQLSYGNWMSAQMQARTLAKNLLGERASFELVSSYSTNLLGKEIVFIGDASREHASEVRQIASEDGVSVEVFDREGKTVGAVLIGDVTRRAMITKAIKTQTKYEQ